MYQCLFSGSSRPDWREERKINVETFGVRSSSQFGRRGGYRGVSGGYRGGRGRGGGGRGDGMPRGGRGMGSFAQGIPLFITVMCRYV